MLYVNHFIFFIITFSVDLYRKFSESFVFLCRLLLLVTNIVFVESSIKMKKNKIKFLKTKKKAICDASL